MARGLRRTPTAAWSTDAAPPLDVPPDPSPSPTATPAPAPAARSRKFSASLDATTDARFARLTAELVAAVGPIATRHDRGIGRVRNGYDPSRADLLRALLAVAEHDPAVRDAVHEQVRRDLSAS